MPLPLFSKIDTLPLRLRKATPLLATTRSGLLSAFTSAVCTNAGLAPAE